MAKKKNLDNLNTENNDLENDILADHQASEEGESAYDLDNPDDGLDDDDDDFHFEFESEDDDEEQPDNKGDEDESDDQEDADDEESEDKEDEKPPSRGPKRTSKQEKAIVALKREQKKLREENQEMQRLLAKRKDKSETDDLVQKYVADGHDESTAQRMADQDLIVQKQQERLDILEFKDLNADVLSQYPDSLKDAGRIKQIVDVAGISVEQACRGLYGTRSKPTYEQRARSRVAVEDDYDDDGVSRASRGSKQPERSRLTAEQRRAKAYIESKFLDGEKLTDKDFLNKYKPK